MEMRMQPEDGQSSVYDAMIFLSIMLVASALIIGAYTHLRRAEEVYSYEELHRNSVRFANAVLSSTVPNASYVDSFGNKVTSRDISVRDMIIEELMLLESGIPKQNFEGPEGYNSRILNVSSSLLDEDRFLCALSARYGDQEIIFGRGLPAEDRRGETAAQTIRIPVPEVENDITITVHLWWK